MASYEQLYSGRHPKTLNISNGQAMDLSSVWCKKGLNDIRLDIVGRHG
jgi:hypothetical protein